MTHIGIFACFIVLVFIAAILLRIEKLLQGGNKGGWF